MHDAESSSEIERFVAMVERLTAENSRLIAAIEAEKETSRRERHDLADSWNARLITSEVRALEAERKVQRLSGEVERLEGENSRLRGQLAMTHMGVSGIEIAK